MKRLLPILVSFAWLAFIPGEAQACSCIEGDVPVCAAYWRADAVFVGQLLDITPVEKTSNGQMPTVMLQFIIEQPFRGVTGDRVGVETLHGTSCDMRFAKGERYLIYGHRERNGYQLFAGACTRTTLLKHAVEDLNYIRTVTQEEAKSSIFGRLTRDRYQHLPGIKVTVQSGNRTFEGETDEKGNFAIPVPGPGKYTVKAFLPFAADVMAYGPDERGKLKPSDTLTTFEYEVQIAKNECHFRQIDAFKIDLHATAEISGNVLTTSGRPVSPGFVYLINVADTDDSRSELLEAGGSFKFKGVAVGEYYLVLNPRNQAPGDGHAPYPRTYYPNVPEAGAATKIVITEGAKLEHLTLHVG